AQLNRVLGELRPGLPVLARRIVTALDGALVGVAALALQEELQALAPAEPTDRSGVSCHVCSSDQAAVGRPPGVVRDRGAALDDAHGEACRLQAAERGLAAGPGSLHHHRDMPHAQLRRLAGRRFGGNLCREGGTLARAFEPARSCARPHQHVALRIAHRDDRVVERGLDVENALGDEPLRLLLASWRRFGRGALRTAGFLLLCHESSLTIECGPRWDRSLPLRRRRLLASNRSPRALARACVGMGALSTHRKVSPMPQPAIAAQVDEPLDVRRHLAPEVTLHLVVGVDLATDARYLVVGQLVGLAARIDLRRGADAQRRRPADAVDVGEGDLHALVPWQIDAGDACHVVSPNPVLALSQLGPRIRALHPDDALTPDHLALPADWLDRRSYLHVPAPMLPAPLTPCSRY